MLNLTLLNGADIQNSDGFISETVLMCCFLGLLGLTQLRVTAVNQFDVMLTNNVV